jgi:hypothetical protein
METGSRNRGDLMPPGIGQFGPSMAKQHKRTFALFQDKNIDSIGRDGAGRWHGFSVFMQDFAGRIGATARTAICQTVRVARSVALLH